MAKYQEETIVAPGHVVWGAIEDSDSGSGEEETPRARRNTAVSTAPETRPTKGYADQPCKVILSAHAPAFVMPISPPGLFAQPIEGKAKASRRQSRTPSPEPRMPAFVLLGRKFDNTVTSKAAAPFKGAAAVPSDDEDVSTPRGRCFPVRTCAATQEADAEANFRDELDASDEEEVEEVVAGDAKTKKKTSRPFRATRVRYRKFMSEQFSAIANDPFNFNLATVEIPPCLAKQSDSEAKVLLKLHLRAEQAKQAMLRAAP